MTNQTEESSLLSTIGGEISGLPDPIKKTFLQVVAEILGGISAIPLAKIRQIAQGIDDVTAARSMAASRIAAASIDEAITDKDLIEAAAEVYLPTHLRKIKNRFLVAQKAADYISPEPSDRSGNSSAPPDLDWLNTFLRFAEDASSERLQDMFGRILAGQIVRPGAFGLATLRAVSELDQSIADDFTHAWAQSVGDSIDFSSEWHRGVGFARWMRLAEAGLMAVKDTVQYLPEFKPFKDDCALWTPFHSPDAFLLVYFAKGSSSNWPHIDFTRVGREIGAILPKPDYVQNMRLAGGRLPRSGLIRIELHDAKKGTEILFP